LQANVEIEPPLMHNGLLLDFLNNPN